MNLTYVKSANGRMVIKPDRNLKRLLTELYVVQNKTIRGITEETSIPHATVQNMINHFGLMRKKKSMSDAEAMTFCKKNHDLLVRMYVDLGMTRSSIAGTIREKTGLPFKSIMLRRYFEASGVVIRTHAEAIAVATKHGRRARTPRGSVLFNVTSIASWNYHLDNPMIGVSFKQYKRIVGRFTYMVVARFPQFFPHGTHTVDRRGSNLELDHQFSKASGYYKFNGIEYTPRAVSIPLEVMCHPVNLKLMSARSNGIKSSGNHIELDTLLRRIAEFEKEHGDIFEDYYSQYTAQDLIAVYTARKCK